MIATYVIVLLIISFLGAVWSARRKFSKPAARLASKRHHLPRHGVIFQRRSR